MKSGVLSRRKFGVALVRCDGALSCTKTKSLSAYRRRHSSSKDVFKKSMVLVDFSLLRVDEKNSVFPFHDTPSLTINFIENRFLWWQNACKHCFMTCNTISLVSWLIWNRFRWKFIDIFEDVCSLHVCFSADLFHLLCCITPCESSGRYFGPPGYYKQFLRSPMQSTDTQTHTHTRLTALCPGLSGWASTRFYWSKR